MSKFSKAIKQYLTGDVIFSFANSFVSLIRGPIVMLFIPLFMSENAQGYWYTFGSLSALSIFADLGFGAIVGQFSAHEFAHLRFDSKKNFEGEQHNLERISSLYKFVLKWATLVCVVAFPIIMIVGFFVLNMHENEVNWIIPWIIMMCTSGFNFIARISLTFLEGCGQIKNIQINNLVTGIVTSIVTIAMLALRCELYALVIPNVIGVAINLGLMVAVFKRPLMQMLRTKSTFKFEWGKSFLRLIWKYALSWSSGYFIFQIYTPIAFMVYDPAQAGKIGITMTLIQACFTISNTWNAVLVPKMNMAVANRDWSRAESYGKKGCLVSLLTYALGGSVVLLAIGLLQDKISILSRFMGIKPVTILLFAYMLQLPINTIATYGRAHKQEPFLWMSIVGALIIGGSTIGLVYVAPIDYIFSGFLIANIVSIVIFAWMYIKQRGKWHEKFIAMQDYDQASLAKQLASENDIVLDAGNSSSDNTQALDSPSCENIEKLESPSGDDVDDNDVHNS